MCFSPGMDLRCFWYFLHTPCLIAHLTTLSEMPHARCAEPVYASRPAQPVVAHRVKSVQMLRIHGHLSENVFLQSHLCFGV
jgi:hypothetical protein